MNGSGAGRLSRALLRRPAKDGSRTALAEFGERGQSGQPYPKDVSGRHRPGGNGPLERIAGNRVPASGQESYAEQRSSGLREMVSWSPSALARRPSTESWGSFPLPRSGQRRPGSCPPVPRVAAGTSRVSPAAAPLRPAQTGAGLLIRLRCRWAFHPGCPRLGQGGALSRSPRSLLLILIGRLALSLAACCRAGMSSIGLTGRAWRAYG